MTIKSVSYCTSQKLSCCAPQSVYLCLQNVELVGAACGTESTVENETYERSTIAATVASVVHKSNCVYEYTFHYNTENIVDEIVLKSNNITGVICDGCIINLIEDTFGNEPFIDVDIETGAYYFVSNHGCRYELPIATAGITVQDTASVDLTLAGTVLSGDVNVSPDAGNILEERGNGLFVPDTDCGCNDFISYVPNLYPFPGETITSSTITNCQYKEVGNQLFISFDITFTATGGNSMSIDLPPGYQFPVGYNQLNYVEFLNNDPSAPFPGSCTAVPVNTVTAFILSIYGAVPLNRDFNVKSNVYFIIEKV